MQETPAGFLSRHLETPTRRAVLLTGAAVFMALVVLAGVRVFKTGTAQASPPPVTVSDFDQQTDSWLVTLQDQPIATYAFLIDAAIPSTQAPVIVRQATGCNAPRLLSGGITSLTCTASAGGALSITLGVQPCGAMSFKLPGMRVTLPGGKTAPVPSKGGAYMLTGGAGNCASAGSVKPAGPSNRGRPTSHP